MVSCILVGCIYSQSVRYNFIAPLLMFTLGAAARNLNRITENQEVIWRRRGRQNPSFLYVQHSKREDWSGLESKFALVVPNRKPNPP